MENTRKIGTMGELKARNWIEQKGWTHVASNFRKRGFEIDLIALDSNKVLRFIEVKHVVNGQPLDAAYSVSYRNIENYFKGVEVFLSCFPGFRDNTMSMDVMIIRGSELLYYENVSGGVVVD